MIVFGDEASEFRIKRYGNWPNRPHNAFGDTLSQPERACIGWSRNRTDGQGPQLHPERGDRIRHIRLQHEAPDAFILLDGLPERRPTERKSGAVDDYRSDPLDKGLRDRRTRPDDEEGLHLRPGDPCNNRSAKPHQGTDRLGIGDQVKSIEQP